MTGALEYLEEFSAKLGLDLAWDPHSKLCIATDFIDQIGMAPQFAIFVAEEAKRERELSIDTGIDMLREALAPEHDDDR